MRFVFVLFVLVCSSALLVSAAPNVLQDQDDVRGAFLTSRPKEKSTKAPASATVSRRKPKVVTSENKNTNVKTPDNKTADNRTTKPSTPDSSKGPKSPVNTQRMGLGLTLFMRDANGSAVRTDPTQVFHKGDRVRVLLETNTDGYLYIFNTTNDGNPVMIYPDASLDEGGNYLQAHVPFEIPSSMSTEERLRWLAFDENAGDEKLFFVFTKEPLSGLPIDDELIALCRDSPSACPVKPTAEVWAQVQKEMQNPLQADRSKQSGQTETPAEKAATTRGLGLAKDDPQPSMILMASSKTSKLVTTMALVHKE
jgi:hypothetical protein